MNRITQILRMLIVTAVAMSIAAAPSTAPSTARSAADGGPVAAAPRSSGISCVTCGLVE